MGRWHFEDNIKMCIILIKKLINAHVAHGVSWIIPYFHFNFGLVHVLRNDVSFFLHSCFFNPKFMYLELWIIRIPEHNMLTWVACSFNVQLNRPVVPAGNVSQHHESTSWFVYKMYLIDGSPNSIIYRISKNFLSESSRIFL